MGIFKETIGTLTASSTTQLTLVGRTVVRLGGLFKVLNSPTLSTAVSGIGGLDTGTIAASTFYYVYAVSNGTAHGIVASTSNQLPTGFTRYKKVGAFYTNSSSLIFKAYFNSEINAITLSIRVSSAAAIQQQSPASWVSGVASGGTGIFNISISSNTLSINPDCVANIFGGTGSERQTYLISSTTTSIQVVTENSSAGTNLNEPFILIARKQGVDAIQPDWKDY